MTSISHRTWRRWDPATLAVAGLTLVAFALRVGGIDQSLYGDELYTYDDTSGSLSGVFDGLERNEILPPLYFVLAWASAHLGDNTTMIRLPSIVFGTATVPVVYALGRQVFGREAGLLAAGFVALSPFAIFYSVEARPYATMVFFVGLSTLALLRAVVDDRRRWWLVYALSVACAFYSHYTAAFVIGVQALWAIWAHRERLRALALAYAGAALVFLPWLPTFLEQRGQELNTGVIGASVDLTFFNTFELVMRLLVGHPFRHLDIVPGNLALVLLSAGTAVLLVVALLRLRRRTGFRLPQPSAPAVLIVAAAAITPIGLLLYGLVADDLYTSRNLSASMPALAVLAAGAITAFGPRVSRPVGALALIVMVLASIKGLDPDQLRPQSREVAEYIEREAGPRDSVVRGLGDVNALKLYLHGHRILDEFVSDQSAWRKASAGGSVFLVRGEVGRLPLLPRFTGPGGFYELVAAATFRGLRRLGAGRYVGKVRATLENVGDRQIIALSPGPDIVVTRGAVRGFLEKVDHAGDELTVTGWGIATDGSRPADALFVFDGTRAVAIASPTVLRPDVGANFGTRVEGCGFALRAPVADAARLSGSPNLRIFAAVGSRATELRPLQ